MIFKSHTLWCLLLSASPLTFPFNSLQLLCPSLWMYPEQIRQHVVPSTSGLYLSAFLVLSSNIIFLVKIFSAHSVLDCTALVRHTPALLIPILTWPVQTKHLVSEDFYFSSIYIRMQCRKFCLLFSARSPISRIVPHI